MYEEQEVFSNPLRPEGYEVGEDEGDDPGPLSNEDFRRLISGPKGRSHSSSTSSSKGQKGPILSPRGGTSSTGEEKDSRRIQKKKYYARLKKAELEKEKELAQKYRDRAKERREGPAEPAPSVEDSTGTSDYKSVAPTAQMGNTYAERRKQLIQESKYLGGDMEHTHLVKGLDYALLEKVRAEISSKETQDHEAMEEALNRTEVEEQEEEDRIDFHGKMARNVYRVLFRTKPAERNELFLPKRMAYVIELDDEVTATDSDIPTTLIRSKADCPSLESATTLSTNDIVINKLTQILSYLRQGQRDAKRQKKKDKGKVKDALEYQQQMQLQKPRDSAGDSGIYREHELQVKKEKGSREDYVSSRDRGKERSGGAGKKKSYFERPVEEDTHASRKLNVREVVRSVNDRFAQGWAPADIQREEKLRRNAPLAEHGKASATGVHRVGAGLKSEDKMENLKKKMEKKMEIDGYAECYPGLPELLDTVGDSDEEADYAKMDMGSKKGPVGRWDFDTNEEYSEYMSTREALPKAAFQYGVKMADGRKTRRAGPKDEKAALDREWQQIQGIINKRKQMAEDGDTTDRKKSRY